ncbi:MAG: recombination-associated protein RdgC [Xanthomonadaceae bacterium]|jgi:recombination associated protein RdgC|nr:recombination-associated protein RdgC [Xanthomonadaceae bacterium]
MFYRNITFYRFPSTWGTLLPSALDQDLATGLARFLGDCRLKPVAPLDMTSIGFIPPFGRTAEALTHHVVNATWLTVGSEAKILPAAVLNDLAAKKVEDIKESTGQLTGGWARKAIRDDLLRELLPKAFVRPGRTDAYIDHNHQFIAVDTPTRGRADTVVSEIRRAVGSFPALPLNAEVAPRNILTGWLAGEEMPDRLVFGEECELKDPIDGGAVVKLQNQDLICDEITKHLESGKQVTRLALNLDDHLSFVLGEDLVVRKLKFLDSATDALDRGEPKDLAAELEARFVLQVGEIRQLWKLLKESFRISDVNADGSEASRHG